jgi:outer membrane protein assembly factor BamB
MAVVVALAALTACSRDDDSPPATGQPPAGGEAAPTLTAAWETTLRAMHVPAATDTGFAFYRFTPERDFQVVSLDAETGEVRWKAAASPSAIVGGEGLQLATSPDRKLVIWLKPGKKYTSGGVSVTASDEATGEPAWSFGGGKLEVDSTPSLCRDGEAFCVVGRREPGARTSLMELDLENGELLRNRPLSQTEIFRELSDGLRDDGKRFLGVNQAGRQLWSRTYADVFGGADVTPDFGWDIQRQEGRFVGSVGYRDVSGPRGSIDLRRMGDTAGFDARTGRTLWVKHGATVQCGSLQFLVDHPMRCSYQGRIVVENENEDFKGLDVTLEGFDPKTGKATWTWRAGNVPALVNGGPGVTRIGTAQYAIKTAKGTTILDADEGPVGTAAAGLVGWCDGSNTAVPRAQRQIALFDEEQGYATVGWFPCKTNGQSLDVPPSTPSFATATVAGVSVFTTEDGEVRAAKPGG